MGSNQSTRDTKFAELLQVPVRNGLYKPKEFHGRGTKIVNMGELFAYPRLSDVHMRRLELTDLEIEKNALAAGDLLFARRFLVAAGAGRCAIVTEVNEATVFESSIIRARPDPEKVNSHWLFYFFSAPQGRDLMETIIRQMAVSGITGRDLAKLRVPLPSRAIQDAGADVLRLLDDRIDLLRQTNTSLEAIAQALFKSWFVDFDPVRAKAEGREPEGMDPATAALFPSEFQDSELGRIPKGWRPVSFGDVAALSKSTIRPMATPAQEFQHYSLPAFDAGQLPLTELGEAIKSNKTPVPSGAVLVSKLNPHIPRIWCVGDDVGPDAVCSTEFLVWTAKPGVGSAFVYALAASPAFNSAMRQLVTGTSNSHQRVRPGQLAEIQAAVISDDALATFEVTVRPMVQQINHNRRRAAKLVEARDALLPRLISGRLRLPGV